MTAIGQSQAPQARRGSAENALIGIALYDTGAKVISRFGSPDEILAVSPGGTAGGTGGSGGPASGGGRAGGGRGPAGAGTAPEITQMIPGLIGDPFGNGSEWVQGGPPLPEGSNSTGDAPPGRGGPAGGPDGGGRGGGGGGVTGGSTQKVIFTRWVYKRNGSKYAFVLDKFNRVIQVEAIGLSNKSVRTKRGISFGSSFGSVIKAYNAPDGYEISGDNMVVRFLVRDHVAFRLSRLKADKPHVVTGVVVAAGKT